MNLHAIAAALGGEVRGLQVLAPGPGHSFRDRSLAVRLDQTAPDGFITYSHAGDDWRACRDHVRTMLGLPPWEPGDGRRRAIPPSRREQWDMAATDAQANDRRSLTEDDLIRITRARAIWEEALDPRGTITETYLRHRALDLSHELAGTVLRFHPSCPWRDENTGRTDRVPALIAAFRSIDDGGITGIHRVALTSDGVKIGRRMLGLVHRAAINFDDITGDTLVIGEGIETCLAGRQLGFVPAWALGSVGAISFFPVIDGIRRLVILGERGEASARAIQICGRRWQAARRRVTIVMPSVGDDLNDEVRAKVATNA
jgi:putative DNA primase/helicase